MINTPLMDVEFFLDSVEDCKEIEVQKEHASKP